MDLGDTLRALRIEKGWTQVQVIERLSALGQTVSKKAMSRWECGGSEPSIEQFISLCEVYGVRDVLHVFRGAPNEQSHLNAVGKQRANEYIRLLSADEQFSIAPKERTRPMLRTIPLYDMPVSAGTGQFLDSSEYTLIEVEETVPLSATYAVRITGDSMIPRFVNQQIVYVKQQQTLSPGEIGIFILNGDVFCKQLGGSSGEVELQSLNKKYAPIIVREADELRVLGKVVA